MSSGVKKVFGGTDDSSQKAQQKANTRSQAFIESQAKLARGDALDLFPAAEKNLLAGNQAALDALAGFYPQQYGAVQGGMEGARQAILGTGYGESTFTPDLSFVQQVLPALRPDAFRFGTASAVEGSPVYTDEAAALAKQGLNPSLPMLPEELAKALQGGSIGDMSPYAPTGGQPPVSVNPPQEKLPAWMQNIKTNRDFISAASQGLIPNITSGDQGWFAKWLAEASVKEPSLLEDNWLVSDPRAAIDRTLGRKGGLNAGNELKLQNALNQLINRPQASSKGTSAGVINPSYKFLGG